MVIITVHVCMLQKNIARSHDCELFIKVFVGMRKNSVAYRSGKHLVDNVKIRKFKKYIHKQPKEREKLIPKSIDLDEVLNTMESSRSSPKSFFSSDSNKVVEKNTHLLAFLGILFSKEDIRDEIPGMMSGEAMEIITSSDKIAK